METDFKVKVGEFEGPLEVLLDLIERRKMHVSDFSLSQVADDFISHTRSYEEQNKEFPMADSADFILIASTLLLIKSKALLPNLELTQEEQGNIDDLEKRLALYQIIRSASFGLNGIYGKTPLYFANEKKSQRVVFSPDPSINLESLFNSIQEVLKNVPRVENLPKVAVQKVISLEEMIDSLSNRIQKSIKMSFKDFAGDSKNDKVLVIVSFLAMLELVKQGIVRATQEKHFEDISIESESLGVPRY